MSTVLQVVYLPSRQHLDGEVLRTPGQVQRTGQRVLNERIWGKSQWLSRLDVTLAGQLSPGEQR